MSTNGEPTLQTPQASGPWHRGMTRYHWFVLVVASLGWLFDTMDQQLFILARTPAMKALIKRQEAAARGASASATSTPATSAPAISSAAATSAQQIDHALEAKARRYAGWATTLLMFGWATGGLVFGMLGDRWGRARTMLLTIVIYSVFTGLSALAVGWLDFCVYRFLTGLGVGGEFAAGASLVAEVMPASARPRALGFLQALSALGNMTAAIISFALPPQALIWGVQGWRLMFLVGILPAIVVIFVRRRLQEPESWVRAKQARDRGPVGRHSPQALGRLQDLFIDPRWRRNTLVGVTLAVAGIMGLWGAGFWMPELVRDNALRELPKVTQDRYASLASLLQNAGAFFGIYVFSVLTGYIGRRWTFAVSFLLGMVAVVGVFGFMTRPSHVWWMAPALGFATLMVFGGYSIYFPELFPTRLRSTGTGFCYNVARYLAASAPFLLPMLGAAYAAPADTARGAAGLANASILSSLGGADNPFRYAAITLAGIYLVGLLALPFAPETRGKPLPE